MRVIRNAFYVISGLAILVLITAILWFSLAAMPKEVVGPILAGLLALGGIVTSQYLNRRATLEQELRAQKKVVYEEFLEFLFNIVEGSGTKKSVSEQEMKKFLFKWTPKMIMWGSDKVFKAYVDWKRAAGDEGRSALERLADLENLLLELRLDVGHENKTLDKYDLLRTMITDIDQVIKV